jgi:putative spermidine/putrescine transport system permease protein
MTLSRLLSWFGFVLGARFFLVPLTGTLAFSLRARRGVYSLDACRTVLPDPMFQQTMLCSLIL